jgi:hypothetical protein
VPFPEGGSACARRPPLPGAWWLALVQGADERWRAVALAPTAKGATEAALSGALDGNLLLTPTDPPPGAREQLE